MLGTMLQQEQQNLSKRSVRLFAIGNRINVQAAKTPQHFSIELERIVRLAVPDLAQERPNLIVLGEVLGLPLALSGPQGILSRSMHSASNAITLLSPAYARRMLHYRRVYPGISLVRSLLLSLSDVLYRPFVTTLSHLAAKYSVYLSATTIVPHVQRSISSVDVRHFGQRGAKSVYLPESSGIYNTGFLWGPDGKLLGTTDKVFITEGEQKTLDLSSGDLNAVQAFPTEFGKVGFAISLDAFTPEYLRRLDELEVQVIMQNDANDQLWTLPSKACAWQPQEWLNSVLGSVQEDYTHLSYNVCPMQVGNFFDITFDGQSTITKKSNNEPDPKCNFVGNEGFFHTVTGKPFKGDILAVSPWFMEDPGREDASLSLEQRRTLLTQAGIQLLSGGKHVNRYPESVIFTDI